MSYDEDDAARDEFYEEISRELYSDHKDQAISEFTEERLKSFYLKSPMVMRPAIDSLQKGNALLNARFDEPALVFYVSSIELFLKATLLKPVIYGLVHHEGLAEIIVNHTLSQTGFDRYENLLAMLFESLADIDIKEAKREGANANLLGECKTLQTIRNKIIHKGVKCSNNDSNHARAVAVSVFNEIVMPMLHAIGLKVGERGIIEPA